MKTLNELRLIVKKVIKEQLEENYLNIDRLLELNGGDYYEEGTTMGSKWKGNSVWKIPSSPYLEYTLYDGETEVVLHINVVVVDSWPEQREGSETEPISAGSEYGFESIEYLTPIQKMLSGKELNQFLNNNPNFAKIIQDTIDSTDQPEYDGW
jgi:hypothetical protein